MLPAAYNWYLSKKLYNFFTRHGGKQCVESSFFTVFKQIRKYSKIQAPSIFFVFDFFTYLCCSIELLAKKKGRRWFYAPYVVKPRRQFKVSSRLIKKHLYASLGWPKQAFVKMLFTSIKFFFNDRKNYFKIYKIKHIKKLIYSRIYKRYRWK